MEKHKMKVLQIIPNLKKGGAERLCLDISHALKREDVEVEIVLLEESIEYKDLSKGLKIQTFPLINDFSIRNPNHKLMEKLKVYIQEFKPDVVHTHLFVAELVWKMLAIKEIPSVFHIHDNIKTFDPFEKGLFKKESLLKLYEFTFYKCLNKRRNNHYLSISKDTNNYVIKKLKLKNNQVTLLHNAINRDVFISKKPKSIDSIKMVSIGSMVDKKGHAFLLEMVTKMKSLTDKPIELQILGDGPLRKQLESKIVNLNLNNNVNLLGLVDHPEKYLENANVYVHGAYEEPFGLVLLEAMASGLPVFTTDGVGNRDLIENEKNGYIYFDREPKKMAQDILNLLDSESAYQSMSKAALKFSLAFDIKQYALKLIDTYKLLLK